MKMSVNTQPWLAGSVLLLASLGCGGGSQSAAPDGPLDSPPLPREVGTMECEPIYGACPEGCHPVQGAELDQEANCSRTVEMLACSRSEGGGGAAVCYSTTDGTRIVVVSGEAFYEPYFVGWHVCSEEQAAATAGVGECP